MKALIILFILLLAFITFLSISCGNPVDYSKLELIAEKTELSGDVELPKGTITILLSYTGRGEFEISKWYPDEFIKNVSLYGNDQSLKIHSSGGVYSYQVRGVNLKSVKFYE